MVNFGKISKKAIAFLVAISVILSSVVVSLAVATINTTPASTINSWSGEIADSYAGGTGTATDPYLIATPEQLSRMIGYDVLTNYTSNIQNGSTNKYYKLTADIYLNDVSEENWYEGDNLNYWYSSVTSRFCGNFDGDGHTIYGLCFQDGATHAGLFSFVDAWDDARTIKNLTISHSYMKGGYAGGIIAVGKSGTSKKITFENCYVTDTVIVEGTTTGSNNNYPYEAGIVGYSYSGNTTPYVFQNCASLAKQQDGSFLKYGFIGLNATWYMELYYTISNSFAYANSWHGVTSKGTSTDCYLIDDLSLITGTSAKSNMPNLNWGIWQTTTKYPTYKKVTPNGTKGEVWSGAIAQEYAGGTGTEGDPYLIETPEQLARMVGHDVLTNYTGNIQNGSVNKYYKLTADIYLNDVSSATWYNSSDVNKWYSSAASRFCGSFDGDGYTIYGLYTNPSAQYCGLFPVVDAWSANRTFKDVTISKSYISSNHASAMAGAIAGRIYSGNNKTVYFNNCYVTDSVVFAKNSSSNYWGGIVGYAHPNSSSFFSYTACAVLASVPTASGFVGCEPASGTTTIANSFTANVNWCPANRASATDSYRISDISKIYGTAAKTAMPALAWNYIWQTTENGYPTYLNREYDVNGNVGGVWSGLTALDYAGGSGTEVDPYKIATAEQFVKMLKDSSNAGKYYELISDIKFNDTSVANWQENARSWSCITNRFKGYFNGKGHTVSGLYYNGTENNIGLFCVAQDATIENLILDNSFIKSSGYAVGGIIGQGVGSINVNKCIVGKNVAIESTYEGNDAGAGGIVGYGNGDIKINTCAVLATVSATRFAGSMAGNCWTKVTVKNSYSSANIKFCSKRNLETESDFNYSTYEEGDSSVVYVSPDAMIGEAAKEGMEGLSWDRAWVTTDGYPMCKFDKEPGAAEGIWSGNIASEYAGGSGTKADPYLIENGEQLALMVTDVNSEGKYYKLTKDIKLNDTSANKWTNSARQWIWTNNIFKGNVDGEGHQITGLYYNGTKSKVGLISYAANAYITRVIINNASLTSNGFAVGAIVGDANTGKVTLSSCYVGNNVKIKSTYNKGNDAGAGGLIGYGGAEILVEGCTFLGSVSAPKNAGAILGNCWGKNSEGVSGIVVKNTYSPSSLKFCSKQALGGTSGDNYSAGDNKEPNVYTIKANQMYGKNAKKNMPALNWFRFWKVTDGYPMVVGGTYDGVKGKVWSGKVAANFAGGNGTKGSPYLISTGEQLALLLENVNDTKGKYYKITNDIYLNDVKSANWYEGNNLRSWYWVSTARHGAFKGHLNGNAKVIYGLYMNHEQINSVIYTGLFPTITDGASVTKLGFSNARITVKSQIDQEAYAGCIAGVVMLNQPEAQTKRGTLPKVSQCFADSKSVITCKFAGGLFGGGSYVANMDNCYFVGQVVGERVASLVGNSWTTYKDTVVQQCYSATVDENLLCGGRASVENSSTPIDYKNNYSTGNGLASYVMKMGLLMMRGEKAKKYMTELDFDKIWYALPNGTPVLRAFGTTDKFSNTTTPDPIEVSFVTNGGSKCENAYGNPEEPITLPTPTREGYKFAGWYVYKELDMPYPIDTFPYFNMILYAKWEPNGIIVDFENYPNTPYDYEEDYEYYRPGTVGYDAKYVRNGMASFHRIGEQRGDKDFLLNYDEMLEVGKKYKLTFWVTTDADKAKTTLSIVHEKFPDVFDDTLGVEQIAVVKNIKNGEWQMVEATFVAKTKWLAIRTSGKSSIYFDDLMMVPEDAKNAMSLGVLGVVIPVAIGGVVLVAAGILVAVIIIKKKKNKV